MTTPNTCASLDICASPKCACVYLLPEIDPEHGTLEIDWT